jgi:hypothetical protein
MMILIAASSGLLRISRHRSKPSISGLMTSLMTQSGRSIGISGSALRLDSSHVTLCPPSSSTAFISCRMIGSSSTIRNFMAFFSGVVQRTGMVSVNASGEALRLSGIVLHAVPVR